MKNKFLSLKFRMLIVTVISLALAGGVFFGSYTLGRFLVWKYYLDDKRVEERNEENIKNFQEYVTRNNLFTDNMDKTYGWSNSRYTELVIYKDSQLIYSPDWFNDDEPTEEITEEATEAVTETPESGEETTDTPEEEKKPEYSYGEGRDFRDYLNEDAKKEYERVLADILEGNRELSPIVFKDGTLLVAVVDYSENFMYGGVVIGSMLLAVIFFMVVMMISFSRISTRIRRLAANVKQVERGNLELPVTSQGTDEIATLASDIDSMRSSIISNMSKEQEAWEANAGLITAMSHDIRTPLTILLGYIDLLELQTDDETSREYLSACRENAIRLKKLSDDMFGYFLVFGRREIKLDFCEHPADDVINHMLDEHIILLSEKGYSVEKTAEIIDSDIYVDLLYLGRVIDNVFSNVNKYANIASAVKVSLYKAEGEVCVEIHNGIAGTNTAESSGIGLKTCTKIMEQMGGRFEIHSTEESFTSIVKIPIK